MNPISMSRRAARWMTLSIAVAATACSSDPEAAATPPIDGTWTGSALQNTAASAGKEEQKDAYVIRLGKGTSTRDFASTQHRGSATVELALFTAAGTDPDGAALVQLGATVTLEGEWTSETYDNGGGSSDLKMSTRCVKVEKTIATGPAAICGQDGVPGSFALECTILPSNATLSCSGSKLTLTKT